MQGWLPRIRGDRPEWGCFCISSHLATPHTRGSTFITGTVVKVNKGYPAYAGIDPQHTLWKSNTAGLPRIRGDRPLKLIREFAEKKATPHTRGSTPVGDVLRRDNVSYPAYAGIDLRQWFLDLFDKGLPRIRGDRPHPRRPLDRRAGATPHTRGSTLPKGLNIMGFNFHFSHVVANSFFGNLDSSLLELFCNFGSAVNLLRF